nr:cyanophycinase [Pseudoalteromonas sp. S16_S37]
MSENVMSSIHKVIFGNFKARFLWLFLMILSAFSLKIVANEQSQTLVLIGGALTTCSSLNPENCNNKTAPNGKTANQFTVDAKTIARVHAQWPSANLQHKNKVNAVLKKIAKQHSGVMNKKSLLWQWRDTDNALLSQLTDLEYYFVLDMLEKPILNKQGRRIKEQVNIQNNREGASNDIVNFIKASAEVAQHSPSLLAVTASSRDPYESADFYEGLLSQTVEQAQWLALTPALAKAITTGQCNKLDEIRQQTMQLFNRENIYGDRIAAEQELCEKGLAHLVKMIEQSTGVMFNGGDQSLTRQVMFDDKGQAYPWTQAILNRPILIGTSAGTAVQSGGKNQFGQVAMISNGSSELALKDGAFAQAAPSARCVEDCQQGLSVDALTYQSAGGLGSFSLGILDTHFSERNRTLRLAVLQSETNQPYGFGVDETTALAVIRSLSGQVMTVVGKHGVVHIKPLSKQQFSYSYWPRGALIEQQQQGFVLSERTVQNALPDIKVPALPKQRFANILDDAKLRSLTQAMCLAKQQQAQAQHGEFYFTFQADEHTRFMRVNKSQFGCGIENLKISFSNNT